MMKRLVTLCALLAMAASTQAATVGTWDGGANDGGLWSNPVNWSGDVLPAVPVPNSGDEIKMKTGNGLATVADGMSMDHNCRISIGTDTGVFRINVTGGLLGANELRVGSVGSATQSGAAELYQTGGVVTASQLLCSRNASTSTAATAIGNGLYVISGGTLRSRTDTGDGRMYIGAGQNSVTGSDIAQQVGRFVVDGTGGTISMKTLYVGGDGTKTGTGTVEFRMAADGASRITLSNAAVLDGGTGTSTGIADLVLSASAPLRAGDIVLVETTSSTAVAGIFDRLNGVVGAATQGASVVLGGNTYKLSYVYDATTGIDGNGNDIALVVPEPITMVFLGLGGLMLRRRLA
jgi:hypothetical protein